MNIPRIPAGRAGRFAVVAAAVGLALVSCTSTSTPPPRTAKVERTALTTGVSATGALSAISEQNIGFPKGGQLTAVSVKVGDRVTKGQILATVDAFPYWQALAQAKGQLQQQQAALGKATSSPVVQGTQDSLAQAQAVLEATKNQADATSDLDDTAVDRAKKQLDFDEHTLDQAEDQLDRDQDACGSSSSSSDSTASLASTAVAAATAVIPNAACSAVPSDKAAVTAAKRAVVADKTALATAQKKRDVDEAAGELSVANAQQAVVSAQNNAASASSDRPFTIDGQAGLVQTAQAAVASAQRDVDNATLRAPVDGTVAAVNGAVGEFIAPSSSTTALAPGSDSPIPGAGASAAAAGAAAASPSRPGGSQFLVLDDVHEFQLVVPFGESDATQITPSQKVNITLDAVPDLTPTGTVLSVAPTGTAISGVISYYVTITVDGADPRLKSGLTAHAAVITNETDNVLTVPNAAVRKDAGKSTVTVLGADGTQQSVPFTPGIVGDQSTQVISGLQEGQQIVLPAGQ